MAAFFKNKLSKSPDNKPQIQISNMISLKDKKVTKSQFFKAENH